jgi:hypothetical protein
MTRRVALLVVLVCVVACARRRSLTQARAGDGGPAVVVVDPRDLAVVPEREPNDDAAQALVFAEEPARVAVRGTIGAAPDRDLFRVSVEARATLRVRLSAVPGVDLALDVTGAAGKLLVTSDNGSAAVAEGVPNLVLTPGTYQLVVREYQKTAKGKPPEPRTVASGAYLLEATLLPPPPVGEEVEPNDQAAFAGEVALGETVTGFVGWRRDRDVFRIQLAGAGEDQALSVDVDAVPEVALRVAVLDATEAVLVTRQGKKGESVGLRNVAIRPGEAHYFVEVTAKKANLEERYALRTAAVPFQLDEEAEPNDTAETASPLADVPGADSGVRVGFLGPGDTDVFRLDPLGTPRALHVACEPPPDVGVELSIVDQAGQVASTKAGSKGAPVHLDAVSVPPSASLYVRAVARAGGDSERRYRLRWSTVPAEEMMPVPGIDE